MSVLLRIATPVLLVALSALFPLDVLAQPAGGCEKDTDCKLDRICVERQCQNPDVRQSPSARTRPENGVVPKEQVTTPTSVQPLPAKTEVTTRRDTRRGVWERLVFCAPETGWFSCIFKYIFEITAIIMGVAGVGCFFEPQAWGAGLVAIAYCVCVLWEFGSW